MSFIRVRFITSSSFISRSIRFVTNSLFSHTEFGIDGKWVGAHSGDGVQERAFDYCAPSREYVYEIPCSEYQAAQLQVWVRSQIGKSYNYWDIVGLLLKNRNLNSPGRMICSQFVTEGLLMVFGANRVLNVLPDYAFLITPETLHLSPIFVGRRVKKVG